MLTPDVTVFLLSLLNSLTLNSGDQAFKDTALLIDKAQQELAALQAIGPVVPTKPPTKPPRKR